MISGSVLTPAFGAERENGSSADGVLSGLTDQYVCRLPPDSFPSLSARSRKPWIPETTPPPAARRVHCRPRAGALFCAWRAKGQRRKAIDNRRSYSVLQGTETGVSVCRGQARFSVCGGRKNEGERRRRKAIGQSPETPGAVREQERGRERGGGGRFRNPVLATAGGQDRESVRRRMAQKRNEKKTKSAIRRRTLSLSCPNAGVSTDSESSAPVLLPSLFRPKKILT